MSWYNKAIFAAMAYELAHKCVILPHVRIRQLPLSYKEKEKAPRPLLISESILPTAIATVCSPLLVPFHLMGDLQRMEVAARGLDKELYGIGDIELLTLGNSWDEGFVISMKLAFM